MCGYRLYLKPRTPTYGTQGYYIGILSTDSRYMLTCTYIGATSCSSVIGPVSMCANTTFQKRLALDNSFTPGLLYLHRHELVAIPRTAPRLKKMYDQKPMILEHFNGAKSSLPWHGRLSAK
jgi:hypothetical protein